MAIEEYEQRSKPRLAIIDELWQQISQEKYYELSPAYERYQRLMKEQSEDDLKHTKELLEFAAKAYGLDLSVRHAKFSPDGREVWFVSESSTGWTWSPLNNDGDAFRLAMKLGIGVYETFSGGVEARKSPDIVCAEDGKKDAHYRRAIVRVAAHIGKTKSSTPDL